MDDSTNRDNYTGSNLAARSDLRDSLTLATKLIAVVIVVTILSIGLIICTALFIWMCFKYPQSTSDFIKLLIPTGIGSIIAIYGQKVAGVLINKSDKK